jgi:hypothetical protein
MVLHCHPTLAISKFNPEVYKETTQFLEDFFIIIKDLKVGAKAVWKPSKTGALLTTKSILDIQKMFLEEKGLNFY